MYSDLARLQQEYSDILHPRTGLYDNPLRNLKPVQSSGLLLAGGGSAPVSIPIPYADLSLTGSITNADMASNVIQVQLASVAATNGATSIDSGAITAKRFLWIVAHIATQTSTSTWGLTFNSDTGANYSYRGSANNGADATGVSQAAFSSAESIAAGFGLLIVEMSSNVAGLRKVGRYAMIESVAATSAPDRNDGALNWDNTAAQITSVQLVRIAGTGTLTTNARLAVYGRN